MPLNATPARIARPQQQPVNPPFTSETTSLNPWAIGVGIAAMPLVPFFVATLVMLAPVRWLLGAPSSERR
jgi:hypothetical protein